MGSYDWLYQEKAYPLLFNWSFQLQISYSSKINWKKKIRQETIYFAVFSQY